MVRPALTNIGLSAAMVLGLVGLVMVAVGRVTDRPVLANVGILFFVPILLGAVVASVGILALIACRLWLGDQWTRSTAGDVRAAGVEIVAVPAPPKVAAADHKDAPSSIPLTDLPPISVPIRIEERISGKLWRSQFQDRMPNSGYAGFEWRTVGSHGFMMTLPRTKVDWQQCSPWVHAVCQDLIEDTALRTVIFDVNRLDDTAVQSAVSLLLIIESNTLATARARDKLKLMNVSQKLNERLGGLGLIFQILTQRDFQRLTNA